MTRTANIRIQAIETARQRELRAAERALTVGDASAMTGHLRQAGQLWAAVSSELAASVSPAAGV